MDFGNSRTAMRKGKTYGDTLKKGASGEPVFGRPSKPREEEPPLSQLMQWQPQTLDKSDFKKMKKDLFHFEDPQFEFYRTKIQKAEHPWVSEARDNFRDFKDPDKDIKNRRFNQLSGEYSPPLPMNGGMNGNRGGGGGVDIQHHSMRARKAEYPTAAGANEYGTSLAMGMAGSQPGQGQLMGQQGQYGQQQALYGGQQAANQVQYAMNGAQQAAILNTTPSMLSPSQVVYPNGPNMIDSLPLHSTDRAGAAPGQNAQYQEGDEYENNYEGYEGEEVDPEQAKLDHQHMKDFLRTSRWKGDSYTQKILARPAFCNYGYKNVQPAVGGFLYGQYLHSHNVNPQRGMQPEYRQVYKNAQMFGDRVPPHEAPQIPRPRPATINEEKVKENEMKRNSLEAEKLNPEKDKKKSTMKSSAGARPASAGRQPNANSATNMQGSVARPQQHPINVQSQYQLQPQGQQSNGPVQGSQSQGQFAPKITVTPADLDKQKAQYMNAGDKERLMAKLAKDSGYPGNNNYLSPNDINKTVKLGGQQQAFGGRPGGAPQVGFVDQLSETKKVSRKESGYDGASSIGKYPAYDDDFLEIGSGF